MAEFPPERHVPPVRMVQEARAILRRLPFREILRAGHSTALRLATSGLTLVFGILGARLLGTETFGAYVSLFAVAGLLTVATSTGLPALLQREFSASRGNGDRTALKPLVQGLLLVNGALVLGLMVSVVLGAWAMTGVLAFCLVGNAVGVLAALFIAHERVLLTGWIGNVLTPSVALLALLALARVTTPSPLLPLFAQIVGALAALAMLLALWRGEPLHNARRALDAAWWSERHKAVIRAGLIFAGTQVLINLTTQVDIIILTAMAEPSDVAHYYAAVRAAGVVIFFFAASGLLAEPALTRLHAAGDREAVQALTSRTALSGALVTVGAAIAAVALAPFYLRLYGPDFAVALPCFCVFTAGLVVRSLSGPAEPVLRATRREGSVLVVTAAVLALNAALSAALVPLLGILGAAVGSAVQFALYGAWLALRSWRRSGIRCDVLAFARGARPAAGLGGGTERP